MDGSVYLAPKNEESLSCAYYIGAFFPWEFCKTKKSAPDSAAIKGLKTYDAPSTNVRIESFYVQSHEKSAAGDQDSQNIHNPLLRKWIILSASHIKTSLPHRSVQ